MQLGERGRLSFRRQRSRAGKHVRTFFLLNVCVLIFVHCCIGIAQSYPVWADTQRDWRIYKSNFIAQDGRVIDTGNKGISHSEGQGTGMLLAAYAGDEEAFYRVWRWTNANLQRSDHLFSWRWDPTGTPEISDPNNATDGDLLIAWALIEGHRVWRDESLLSEALMIAKAIEMHAVYQSDHFVLLKPAASHFDYGDYVVVNPSYYVFPALEAIATVSDSEIFRRLLQDGLNLLPEATFGANELPADWITVDAQGTVDVWHERPARFGYEAVRIPLYLIWAGHCVSDLHAAIDSAWARLGSDGSPPSYVGLFDGDTPGYTSSSGYRAISSLISACRTGQCRQDELTLKPLDYSEAYYGASLHLFSKYAAETPCR